MNPLDLLYCLVEAVLAREIAERYFSWNRRVRVERFWVVDDLLYVEWSEA